MALLRPAQCVSGDEALARGDWAEARTAFEAALRVREFPEALEGLGNAAWWLDLADLVFESRERAYRLYAAADDRVAAARVAVWLAWDYWAFRGENAIANGWLQRARRLLEGQPPCWERAWLEAREAVLCLREEGDPVRAQAFATEGVRIARQAGDINFEMLCRAVEGLAIVASGAVSEGMGILDEVNAAVIAGELTDRVAIGLSGCYLLNACDRVRDYGRAEQWCKRLKEFCAAWGLHPLFAVCRTEYASVCMWRGTWVEAEQELCAANDELAASRPAMVSDAVVRLAELRRRQGRLGEAAALFDQVQPHGSGLLGRAELAFDRGDKRAAAEQAERYLRQLPVQSRIERASATELLVRALSDLEERERAKSALADLSSIAAQVATIPLRAAASFASGYVAMADGKADAAREHFEDAVDLFSQSGAPFEVGRARIELARALGKLGRVPAAMAEAQRAAVSLADLKADLEAKRAQELVESLTASAVETTAGDRARSIGKKSNALTTREREVLQLLAEGLSNTMIAERLFLSDHTVHRHVANIMNKLDVSNRAAAVAQAARRGLLA